MAYSIFCDRPWSFMFFVKVHDAGGFQVQAIADDEVRESLHAADLACR